MIQIKPTTPSKTIPKETSFGYLTKRLFSDANHTVDSTFGRKEYNTAAKMKKQKVFKEDKQYY